MSDGPVGSVERGLLTASPEGWEKARDRAAVIGELAAQERVGHGAADEAASRLGLSRRQVYVLVARWRAGRGAVSDLVPGRSSGGRGRGRVPAGVEAVIAEVLRTRYLTRQRPSVAVVHREIARRCRTRGFPVPSRGTVVRRIAGLDPVSLLSARGGADAARRLRSAGGVPPETTGVLEQVQIDHTVVDVMVVDERHRLPLGRPYLTVGIDVASRAILGLVVTLDAPSATSVGLCLAHMVSDKRPWLDQLGLQVEWPMRGKPERLYVDNGADFHSEALQRGCDEHGIRLDYRPPGAPHYGGVVERVIGTMMSQVHELPGTTFSSVAERGDYDSAVNATLTLPELQRWLALAVAGYHGQVHASLSRTPAGVWAEHAEHHQPDAVGNPTAFLVDFLPVLRRTLTRSGFTVDYVQYYSDALKPLIARRERLGRFVLRRDPRDISRIWVLDPDSGVYLQVGYRVLSRPAISVWEQRAAVTRLRELGRAEVDEHALFGMVEQMRRITDDAVRLTRTARRERARRPQPVGEGVTGRTSTPPEPPTEQPVATEARPFAEIEQW